jgi:hypothetical protein
MPTQFTLLGEAVVSDEAIRTINFFNGRLLAGGDLSREQQARRDGLAQLGRALGDGVAYGLMVEFAGNIAPGGRPAVTVTPGLAVNREGASLALRRAATVALDRTADASTATVACLFGDCAPAVAGAYVAGEGLYLLTIAPAFVSEGRAPVSGANGSGARCAYDATAEAVQFRMLRVPDHLHGESAGASDFRNRIAYHCFGRGVLRGWAADMATGGARGDDLVEAMLAHGLTTAEAPLALIHFTGAVAETFADVWAVRRMLCARDEGDAFALIADPRRIGVGRAIYRQFHDQIMELASASGGLGKNLDAALFAFLPPAGFLPGLTDQEAISFFAQKSLTARGPLYIDAACVEALLRESFAFPAITAVPGRPGADHAIWLYRAAPAPDGAGTPNLLFAAGHLEPRGQARFNLNHWDFANYPPIP